MHRTVVTPQREARDMCMTCDGYTEEEQHRWRELTILTNGWAVLGVEPTDPHDPFGGWAFTIGATESFGLQEFIITDRPWAEAGHVLNWVIEKLRDGGTMADLEADQILWQPVHDDHLRTDLFNQFHWHYDEWPRPGQVIQLFPSSHDACATCVKDASVDLSDSTSRVDQNRL